MRKGTAMDVSATLRKGKEEGKMAKEERATSKNGRRFSSQGVSQREKIVDVKEFAELAAKDYIKLTGKNKSQAVRDIRVSMQQLLKGLQKGEELEIPDGDPKGEKLVLKKLSASTFSVLP